MDFLIEYYYYYYYFLDAYHPNGYHIIKLSNNRSFFHNCERMPSLVIFRFDLFVNGTIIRNIKIVIKKNKLSLRECKYVPASGKENSTVVLTKLTHNKKCLFYYRIFGANDLFFCF